MPNPAGKTEILDLPYLQALWADDPSAQRELAAFADLCEPGTRLWVYGWPWCYGVTVTGLVPNRTEEVFGGSESDGPRRFVAPLIAYVRDDTGGEGTIGPLVVVPRAKAAQHWNVLDTHGFLIEGGIESVNRAQQVADDHGPGCVARLGLPADGQYDVRVDDGGGFRDTYDIGARYRADVARLLDASARKRGADGRADASVCATREVPLHAGPPSPGFRLARAFGGGITDLIVVGPGPDGPGPDDTRTQTQTQTDPPKIETAGPGPDTSPGPDTHRSGSGSGPVALGYRLEVRTDTDWTEVRTGYTPPMFEPTQTALDATADTILSNARQMLGLGPADRLPGTRVQTWHDRSGLTGSAPVAA